MASSSSLVCLVNITFYKAVLNRFNANLLTSICHSYDTLKNFDAFCNFWGKLIIIYTCHNVTHQLLLVHCFQTSNDSGTINGCKTWHCILCKEKKLLKCYTCQSMKLDGRVALSKNKITFLLSLFIWKLKVSRTFSSISTCIQDLES